MENHIFFGKSTINHHVQYFFFMFTRGCQQHEFPLGYADYVQSNNWQGYQHVNTLVLNDEKMLRSLGGGQAVYLLVNIQKTIAIYNEFAHLKR